MPFAIRLKIPNRHTRASRKIVAPRHSPNKKNSRIVLIEPTTRVSGFGRIEKNALEVITTHLQNVSVEPIFIRSHGSKILRALSAKLNKLLNFNFMDKRWESDLELAHSALASPPKSTADALEKMTQAFEHTLSAFNKALDNIVVLENDILSLKAEKVTVGMRLNGNDRKKAAVEVIVKLKENKEFSHYVPNKGYNLAKQSITNNPYLYIKKNIEDSLLAAGLGDLAYDSSIYRIALPKFYQTLRSYQRNLSNCGDAVVGKNSPHILSSKTKVEKPKVEKPKKEVENADESIYALHF